MKRTIINVITMLLSLGLVRCSGLVTDNGGDDPADPTTPILTPAIPSLPPASAPHRLSTIENCDDALADLQDEAVANVEASLDSYYQCPYYASYYGVEEDGIAVDSSDVSSTGATANSDSTTATSSAETSFTDTNLQEADVDEADIVKTDGATLFVATSTGVDVFDVRPTAEFSKLTNYEFTTRVWGLFLSDARLVALTTEYDASKSPTGDDDSWEAHTTATLLDVTDPLSPRTLARTWVDGDYITARVADDVLHVVTSASLGYPDLDYPEYDAERHEIACGDSDEADAVMAELQAEIATAKEIMTAQIRESEIGDWLPGYSADGSTRQTASCESVLTDDSGQSSLTVLYSYPLDQGEPEISFVNGYGYEVYASTENFYLASNYDASESPTGDGDGDTADIHRFRLGNDASKSPTGDGELHSYQASANVEGHLLDQFSMSEYDGTLRVATTTGHVSRNGSSSVSSNVHTLDVSDNDLKPLASVTDIAPGEEIYSARFIGDKGYVVTFEKVDPLFVVNLTDPVNPFIEGELIIPGYSTYLHPLGDGSLIGLGKDAEDAGAFSWYQGVKLSVFDVSDGYNPSVTDEEIIGSRNTSSPALYDHHAFTFDAASGILALPLSLYEGGSGGSDSGDFQYNGVHLYSVSAESGIETLAEIEISEGTWDNAAYRTIMIGDGDERNLFVVTDENVYAVDMNGYAITGEEALEGSLSGLEYYW